VHDSSKWPAIFIADATDGRSDRWRCIVLSVVSSAGMAALTGRDSSVVGESGCWWRMVAEGY
jgi:hypothetical protein